MLKNFLSLFFFLFYLNTFSQNNFVGKTYTGIISQSCKLKGDGGCDIYYLATLIFGKDSILIEFDLRPVCSTKAWENDYKYKQTRKVKWNSKKETVLIDYSPAFYHSPVDTLFLNSSNLTTKKGIEFKEMFDSLKYSTSCGDAGGGHAIYISYDSIRYTTFLRGKITKESRTAISNEQWINLYKIFNITSFKQIPNGECRSCFDGCDEGITIYISGKKISNYNGSGKYFDELKSVIEN